jgi:ribosome modulation factor
MQKKACVKNSANIGKKSRNNDMSTIEQLVGSPPQYFDRWNPAMRGAYLKGAKAAHAGQDKNACPYRDKRNNSGRLTWSRAFILAWEDGHQDAIQHIRNVAESLFQGGKP